MLDNTHLKTELGNIQAHLARVANGPRGRDVLAALRASSELAIPASKLLWQALHNDCLRVLYAALAADDAIVDDEIESVYEYVFSVARHYAEILPARYGRHDALEPEDVRDFLSRYADDAAPFGFKSERTRWAGLDTCRRAAIAGDAEPLDHYKRMVEWLCDEAIRVSGVDLDDARLRSRLAEIDHVRHALAERSAVATPGADLRLHAFLGGPRVFGPVTHPDAVFTDDPFDADEVHAGVREIFERMVRQATMKIGRVERGRMLLVLGDSGAGKTHLMRAFRGHVHRGGHGFATYAQMQSRASATEYGRYLLDNVIDSLARPYGAAGSDATGVLELARGLPRCVDAALQVRIARLEESEWSDRVELARHVDEIVDDLLLHARLKTFDVDLLRVLLYLQCNDPRITSRVLKYLRCEPMGAYDRGWIGDLEPRLGIDAPIRMIQELARLACETQDGAFVLMIDQVELARFDDQTLVSFQHAIDALYQVVSVVPSAIAVISCLGDMFEAAKPKLARSMLDRLTVDPPPAKLAINRSADEIEAIVARRLEWLYADAGAVFRREEPTYPIPAEMLQQLGSYRTRTILEECHRFQEACSAAGRLIDDWVHKAASPPPEAPPVVEGAKDLDRLAAEWNDHLHRTPVDLPDDDAALLDLLADGARACTVERGVVSKIARSGAHLDVDLGESTGARRLTIGVTNRKPGRYGFGDQVKALMAASTSRTPVALRTIEFPTGPATDKQVAALVKAGGLPVVCAEGDLRALAAMRTFATPARAGETFDAWRRRDQPILSRDGLARLFATPAGAGGFGATPAPSGAGVRKPVVPPSVDREPRVPPPPRAVLGTLQVGVTTGFEARPYELQPELLVRHSAVLGSPGSGKTTLALNVVEQLLERDVAVLLVDRKGDLAGYAKPDWYAGIDDPARHRRAEALARRLDVRLFTPGSRAGRPLAFGVVPRLDGLPEHEHGPLIGHASSALAAMLRMGTGSKDETRRAILTQAIALLAERGTPCGIEQLIDVLDTLDDALVRRVPRFDDRLFATLVNDLETLRLNELVLFDREAEPLSAETLLARGGDRTPLTIISTRFLGDNARVQAWSSQLFVELSRWSVRRPSPRLQLLVMLDEADHYMPATSKPPSKEPIMDLLKRGRAAGVGVMLATQTPGDLDYRSRDLITSWFVGKIAGTRSFEKIEPLFERKPALLGKLSQLSSGMFIATDDTRANEIVREPSLLRTDQIPDQEILGLARATRGRV